MWTSLLPGVAKPYFTGGGGGGGTCPAGGGGGGVAPGGGGGGGTCPAGGGGGVAPGPDGFSSKGGFSSALAIVIPPVDAINNVNTMLPALNLVMICSFHFFFYIFYLLFQ